MAKSMQPMTPARAARQVTNYIDLLRSVYGTVSDRQPDNLRGDLLLAHILKAESSAGAILLIGQHYHVEEIAVLTRTLSEVVVNACYLLIADELEVARYMKFDYVKSFSRTAKLRDHVPDPVEHPPELVQAISKMSGEARNEIQRTEKDNSWSQNSLEQRAEIADKHWKRANFKTLVLAGGVTGHTATHATLSSLAWFIQLAADAVSEPDEDRSRALGLALHGTAFCLFQFCVALNEEFSLGLDAKLAELERAP